MTKDDKYLKLMEVFADKTIGLGCRCVIKYETPMRKKGESKYYWNRDIIISCIVESTGFKGKGFSLWSDEGKKTYPLSESTKYKIIGHPVYPHHILQRSSKNGIPCKFMYNGRFSIGYIYNEVKNKAIAYSGFRDLTKDLSGQEEEIYDQLLELVSKVNG